MIYGRQSTGARLMIERMPVAVVIGAGKRANAQIRVGRVLNWLAQAGFSPLLWSSFAEKPTNVSCSVELRRVPVKIPGELPYPIRHLIYNLTAGILIARSRPWIVHCNDLDTLLAGVVARLLSLRKIKVIYDSHEDEYSLALQHKGESTAKLTRWLEGLLIHIGEARGTTVNGSIARRFALRGFMSY